MKAPWPAEFPEGRLLEETSRHLTLAFLGDVEFEPVEVPTFEMGLVGIFDRCLILKRVVAWHIDWLENGLHEYQKSLLGCLEEHGYAMDRRDLLSHVTLARAPFDEKAWKKSFEPLPMMATAIHLYESVGNLTYKPIWTHELIQPFEEFEHTADIAFRVRGKDLQQLHLHAEMALAFVHPGLLPFRERKRCDSLDEIIIDLNRLITRADSEEGCPFKAVSFHGAVKETNALEWEMIVDV